MSKKTSAREALDWLIHIVIAVVIGFLIVTFVAQRTVVNKYSMEPTLHAGDNLIVEKISPKLGNLKHGDVVTIVNASEDLKAEGKTIIKRIIALENETVKIKTTYIPKSDRSFFDAYYKKFCSLYDTLVPEFHKHN